MKYHCTGCLSSPRAVAEYEHDLLHVPLCGSCYNRYQKADFSYQDQYCIWCGEGDDGRELFCCDTCSFAFCVSCLVRNFSDKEAARVRATDPWSCYLCLPTKDINKLKVSRGHQFHNIELAYNSVHPPARISGISMVHEVVLTAEEESFKRFFASYIYTEQYHVESIVGEFLHAKDIYKVLYCVSKNLRAYFKEHVLYPMPGLFRTEFGEENNCRLYDHQLVSLQLMTCMENKGDRFGLLRGGILGDEPGLGKTVSMIALCLSTAGTMPKQSDCFWDENEISQAWKDHSSSGGIGQQLLRAVNEIIKVVGRTDSLCEIQKQIRECPLPFHSIHDVECAVKRALFDDGTLLPWFRQVAMQTLRQELTKIKGSLEKRSRRLRGSAKGKRVLLERSLRPSGATLIIVPLVLLEHWFEQMSRHVGLEYLSDCEGIGDSCTRGVVFIDGLGDIVDIEAPLPKLVVPDGLMMAPEHISNYLIVITTFERCAALQQLRLQLCDDLDDISRGSGGNGGSSSNSGDIEPTYGTAPSSQALRTFLGTRWLRLVVDEGHELSATPESAATASAAASATAPSTAAGSTTAATTATGATTPRPRGGRGRSSIASEAMQAAAAADFIRDIAAERRWVMSGTPTTGTKSTEALSQLHRLLCFLRHGVFGAGDEGAKLWHDRVVKPFQSRDPHAWELLLSILRGVLIRHTKNDLRLDDPVHSLVVLDKMPDPSNPAEEASRHIDRALANYIADTIHQARLEWKRGRCVGRQPKAIVFSQHKHDLQGVGHFLYIDPRFGDKSVCEHDGTYRSSELSRFRHSKKKFKLCPLCGHENLVTSELFCDNTLIMVEYLFDNPLATDADGGEYGANDDLLQPGVEPCEAGHGASGRGGHYVGNCLCSPTGCKGPCGGYINALGPMHLRPFEMHNPNLAIAAESDIIGWTSGHRVMVGDRVRIRRREASAVTTDTTTESLSPLLWRKGQLGGEARIMSWRKCGGRSRHQGWHGSRVLSRVKWQSSNEDASILLLHKDGSHGLDLSFATHIFLLEKIRDPALERQIISRAHRMGAKGPVRVQLLQTKSSSTGDEKREEREQDNAGEGSENIQSRSMPTATSLSHAS